jgi:hypothetical protein
MARRDAARACPAGEDLTAFAHGELDAARRAEVSRHLLACPPCRGAYSVARGLLRRLGDLGPDWGDLVPRRAAAGPRAGARAPWRSLLAGAGIAAAFLAAFLVSGGPAGGPAGRAAGPGLAEASAEEVSLLLASQRPDGSWPADPDLGGPAADEAATAAALRALLPDDAGALREGPRARAVAGATRWLLARRRPGAEDPATAGAARNEAAALAALLEVQAVSGDPELRRALEPAVRRLARAGADVPCDRWAMRWFGSALSRASATWPAVRPLVRRLETAVGPLGLAAPAGAGAGAAPREAEPSGSTACAVAVRVLARRGAL